jgi:hypothetical protein
MRGTSEHPSPGRLPVPGRRRRGPPAHVASPPGPARDNRQGRQGSSRTVRTCQARASVPSAPSAEYERRRGRVGSGRVGAPIVRLCACGSLDGTSASRRTAWPWARAHASYRLPPMRQARRHRGERRAACRRPRRILGRLRPAVATRRAGADPPCVGVPSRCGYCIQIYAVSSLTKPARRAGPASLLVLFKW